MTSRPPIALHVGFVKTATSTFQKDIFPHHGGIDYLGLPAPDDGMDALIHRIAKQDSISFDAHAAADLVRDRLAGHDAGRLTLLSYENFTLYESIDKGIVADRLHQLFAPCKIIFTLRRQEDMVRAWYLQRSSKYIIGNNMIDFDLWFRIKSEEPHKSILGDLDFNAIIHHYESLFGADNVGVFCFEKFKQDAQAYTEELAAFLNIDAAPMVDALARAHRNPTITRRQFQFARATADYVPNALYRASGRLIPRKIRSKFSKRLKRSPSARIPESPAADEWIRERVAAGNRALDARRGGLLQAFGYSL
jgi:hypothetical protein